MIRSENKVLQAFLGTLMTWGLTAAGSALVFIFNTGNFRGKRKILDGSLGFAAGVMTAASYWSLLAPAIEMASTSGYYGEGGKYAFGPVAIGFILGGVFVLVSDIFLPHFAKEDPAIALALHATSKKDKEEEEKEEGSTLISAVESASVFDYNKEDNSSNLDVSFINPDDNHMGKSAENVAQPASESCLLKDSLKMEIRNRKKDYSSVQRPQV